MTHGANIPELFDELDALVMNRDLTAANEATTRIAIIDRVLTDCLGWPPLDLHPEQYESAGGPADKQWLDYCATVGDARCVIEAKRIGSTFQFAPKRRRDKYKLSTLRQAHGPELKAALGQVLRYCGVAQTPFFVVTNGRQWIVGVSQWPGASRDEIECVVFHDLADLRENAERFISLASPRAIAAYAMLPEVVTSSEAVPVFARRINEEFPFNPVAQKNYLSVALGAVMEKYFKSLNTGNEEFEDRCYVASELTDGYVQRLSLFAGNTKPDSLRDAQKLDRARLAKELPDGQTAQLLRAGNLVIVAGSLGSGKTEFARHVVRRARATTSSWVVLASDLIGYTELAASAFDHDSMRNEIAKQLLAQAEENYATLNPYDHAHLRGMFSAGIRRILSAMSPSLRRDERVVDQRIDELIRVELARPYSHLIAYTTYLVRHRSVPVTIIVDNVDRGTEAFERFVFLFSKGLADQTGATIVTTMRDSTYESGRRAGFLDVGGYSTFTISPPSFISVVTRRFQYAQAGLRADEALRHRLERQLEGYPLERVEEFVTMLAELVLARSRDLAAAIQNIAGPNVRTALDLLIAFTTSRNTDVEWLAKKYNAEDYHVPVGRLIQSLMKGDRRRYDEQQTPEIANLFRVSALAVESHFVRIRVLQFLLAQHRDGEHDVAMGEAIAKVVNTGPSIASVERAIDYLRRTRLLTSRSHPDPPWPATASIRATSAGQYYLDELLSLRAYIENVLDDTVIYDPGAFDLLATAERDKSRPFRENMDEKVRVFLRYLGDRESAELKKLSLADAPWCERMMPRTAERILGVDDARSLMRRDGRFYGSKDGETTKAPLKDDSGDKKSSRKRRGRR